MITYLLTRVEGNGSVVSFSARAASENNRRDFDLKIKKQIKIPFCTVCSDFQSPICFSKPNKQNQLKISIEKKSYFEYRSMKK